MIGLIGTGSIGTAIIKGMVSNNIKSEDIFSYDRNNTNFLEIKNFGINICQNCVEVVKNSKYIFLALKPNIYEAVLNEINKFINEDHVIIIMAAGFSISKVKDIIGNRKVVGIMPNTPALVGKGFTAVYFDNLVSSIEKNEVIKILNTLGAVKEIQENYVNAYSALTGSGPAYVFMMIEAMADAAVLMGISRRDAYEAAEHTVMGSAQLALETAKHPGELKDMVCSPGGTTIEGVRTLEENGFRSNLIECLISTYKKNFDLSKIR